jgi:MYXO-CTERM domain-containing protein
MRLPWLASLLAVVPSAAFGHAGLRWPPPRCTAGNNVCTSIKSPAPCGNYPAGTGVRTDLVAGATVNVEFDETINHTGWFQLWISENGDSNYVLVQDQIPHNGAAPQPTFANPRPYSYAFTVPNTPCANCSLRLIQVMTDRNPPTNYYSCADIQIVPPGGPVDAGVPNPDAAVPTPDSGTPPGPDAGPIPDTGLPAPDAGPTPNPDAAGPAPDAGNAPAPDSGVAPVPADGGPAEDAAAGAMVRRAPLGGGGCRATGAGEPAPLAIALIGLVLALSRRRSR